MTFGSDLADVDAEQKVRRLQHRRQRSLDSFPHVVALVGSGRVHQADVPADLVGGECATVGAPKEGADAALDALVARRLRVAAEPCGSRCSVARCCVSDVEGRRAHVLGGDVHEPVGRRAHRAKGVIALAHRIVEIEFLRCGGGHFAQEIAHTVDVLRLRQPRDVGRSVRHRGLRESTLADEPRCTSLEMPETPAAPISPVQPVPANAAISASVR